MSKRIAPFLFLIVFTFLSACTTDTAEIELQISATAPASATFPAPVTSTAPAAPTSTAAGIPTLDKWALWTNGTQLRGANTWQRIVVPKYDGGNFLGDGYIGPPYTQADFDALAALGANYVNLSHPGVYTERPPYVLDEKVVENLDKMIGMAANADMFAVITFRTGPGRNDFTFYRDDDWFAEEDLIENLWSDTDAQAAWAEMWRYTAERYRDNPVVVGYDLICEPNANEILDEWDKEEFFANYGGSVYDWNRWYPAIVAAIREVDGETPILVGGEGYSALDWLPYLELVDAERIVYTFHQYAPSMYTHQYPDEGYTYPGEFDTDYDGEEDAFDRNWISDYLNIAAKFSAGHGVPVAVNEYGVVRWAEGAPAFMRDEMEVFEELGINYALWVWDPVWQPWNEGVNFMTFRFGSDPNNITDVENDLQDTIMEFWAKNSIRPSDFLAAQNNPAENMLANMSSWFNFIGNVPTDETGE